MPVTTVISKSQWHEILKKEKGVIIFVTSGWCSPCKAIAPHYNHYANDKRDSKVKFYKVDSDDHGDIANDLGINSVPAFVALKDGEKSQEVRGANPTALQRMINQLCDEVDNLDAMKYHD